MADISYLDAVELISKSYGDGSLTWTETSQALANAGITSDNYLSFFENSGVFDVVKNSDGTARSITWKTAESISDPLNQISTQVNSNVGSSVVSESAYVEVPGDLTIESGASSGTFSAGVKAGSKIATGTRFVFGEVAPAVGAAMTGCALGKTIDGAIYDIGTAIGANPPWSLNPETWGSLVSDIDENDPLHVQWAGKALQFLLGVDPDTGTTTAYMDENAAAAYAYWLYGEGLFDSGQTYSEISTSQLISGSYIPVMPAPYILGELGFEYTGKTASNWARGVKVLSASRPVYIAFVGYGSSGSVSNFSVRVYSESSFTYQTLYGTNWTNRSSSSYTYNGITYYYGGDSLMATADFAIVPMYPSTSESGIGLSSDWNIAHTIIAGTHTGGETIPGTGDQSGAVLPDTSTWTDFNSTKQYLDSYFPNVDSDFNDKKVTQTIPQQDGSQKTYTYIPVPFVNINDKTDTNPSTGDFGQVNPEITPNTDPVTNPIVSNIPKLTTNPVQSNPDVPSNPPDTGSGNSPTVVIPSDNLGTGLWAIYRPTKEELHSFGAWLWSSNFVDQIKKLFNNPMDAIIGLHQVYSPVEIAGQITIRCGYLDSGVTSYTVSKRYSTVDCGTLPLQEYFGNVFDYDPYTQISLYLPFIGVVPLKTADVMRARLTVIYHVDVLTGACLAEVQVKRDGVGGIIYTFTGSCAVSLPFTSGSYMGAVSSGIMAGINAIGLGASFASGNMLAGTMFAGGIAGNILKEQTNIQKSGSFSGNAGAMGGKTPYLIITRPQTELADNYQHFVGIPSNENVTLGSVSGYARVKSVHVESVTNASEEEKREIESLLKSGVLIQ